MQELNPAHVKAVIEKVNQAPYFKLISLRLCALGPGWCRLEVDLGEKHCNPYGGVHGGVYATVIDTAAYWSLYGLVEEETGYTSVDLAVSNLGMVQHGKLLVEGKTLKTGRSICLAEATAKDENGKLLAHGVSNLLVVQQEGPAKSGRGFPDGAPLPPKFLGETGK